MPITPNTSVLLVDDDDGVRKMLKIYLERSGISVIEACSGEIAMAIFARDDRRIGLLITDLVMPGLCGAELAALIRKCRPHLPVLFISGYSDEFPAESAGVRCLQKPIDLRKLSAEIAHLGDFEAEWPSALAAPPS
jgi:DNA-binding response OmpR family regulator